MTFADFLESASESQAGLIAYLDKEFLSLNGVTRKMRFRIPFYDYGKWICYLNPVKEHQVELCFLEGKLMKEAHPLLDLRGRKKVSGFMMNAEEDIPIQLVLEMIASSMSIYDNI